jgi:hypothetical protein
MAADNAIDHVPKRVARVLAKPIAFTFLGMVLTALATNHLMENS